MTYEKTLQVVEMAPISRATTLMSMKKGIIENNVFNRDEEFPCWSYKKASTTLSLPFCSYCSVKQVGATGVFAFEHEDIHVGCNKELEAKV